MLADTELNINGTSFKGVYVAILLSLSTTLGGGVWTASSLYGRLEAVEGSLLTQAADGGYRRRGGWSTLGKPLDPAKPPIRTRKFLVSMEASASIFRLRFLCLEFCMISLLSAEAAN